MSHPRVLVVDDDDSTRASIRDFLDAKGFATDGADGCESALAALRAASYDAITLDYALPDGDAIGLLPRIKGVDPDVPVVILTGQGTIELAVQAIKEGAENFLTKPVSLGTLTVVLERLFAQQRSRLKSRAQEACTERASLDPFVGSSAAIRTLADQARRVAAAGRPVLIHGETGTGKGVLARWLHRHGPRAEEAFVDLNCAGLARDFLETELFGHEKGAFTGAASLKVGLLELAHRGTVFLDEIGDMDLAVQPKVLKVLEEKTFRRMGGVRDREIDVALVSASHHDLERRSREQLFRADLYYRLSAIPLHVPALRDRREDLQTLSQVILGSLAAELGRRPVELEPSAVAALAAYPWPGNIRELRNVLERAALLSDRDSLGAGDLRLASGGAGDTPAPPGTPPGAVAVDPPSTEKLTLEQVEKRHIEQVLRQARGRVEQAAKDLGIPRSTLYARIKKLGIATDD